MESQKDLVNLVVHANAGKSVMLEEVTRVVEGMLEMPLQEMHKAGFDLAEQARGATERTYEIVKSFL